MDNREDGSIAACLEAPEFRGDIDEPIAEHPGLMGNADPCNDRDGWMTIDSILGLVTDPMPDLPAYQSCGTTAIGELPRANRHAPNSCPQGTFVAELSLAVSEALFGSPRHLERFLPSDPTIERLLQARGAANEMPTEPARLYLRSLYSAILTWAAAHKAIKWSGPQQPVSPLPKWRFARVREYVDSHIEEVIRLRDLARVAGLSQMHFAAQFRAYTGISPIRFVMMRRIQQAQALLSDPRKPLADVALSAGFRTQAHFTTVFHRYVGKTPGCWRKTLLAETLQ